MSYTIPLLLGLDHEKSPRPIADAARTLAGAEGAIGVFDYRSLVGAMAYYGGGLVVELPDEAAGSPQREPENRRDHAHQSERAADAPRQRRAMAQALVKELPADDGQRGKHGQQVQAALAR